MDPESVRAAAVESGAEFIKSAGEYQRQRQFLLQIPTTPKMRAGPRSKGHACFGSSLTRPDILAIYE